MPRAHADTVARWGFSTAGRPAPGAETPLEREGSQLHCPGCGSTYYANSAPCVSALVEDAEGRVLLARRAVEPYLGLWDCPGGFLEEGEHPLDGLRRELEEETGLVARAGAARRDLDGRLRRRARSGRDAQHLLGRPGRRRRAGRGGRRRRSSAGFARTSSRWPTSSRSTPSRTRSRPGARARSRAPTDPSRHEARRAGPRARGGSAGKRVRRRRGRASARSRPSAARRSRRRTARRRGTGSSWGSRRRRSAAASSCSWSMLTLTSFSSSSRSAAMRSRTGATAWHGPHHSAQKSTSTGLSLLRTSSSKVAVVTSRAIASFRFRW